MELPSFLRSGVLAPCQIDWPAQVYCNVAFLWIIILSGHSVSERAITSARTLSQRISIRQNLLGRDLQLSKGNQA
jgi:hypothetical protein